jgi:hypothetical protein
VQVETGHPHVLDGPGLVELAQDGAYLVHQVGSNSAGIALLKEPFQALMPKADYHTAL